MKPQEGNWIKVPNSGWKDTKTGFMTNVDPSMSPETVDLPDIYSQADYNRFERERDEFRKQSGTYQTAGENKEVQGGNVDRVFTPKKPKPSVGKK